ncbi:MAG: hypothetical protein JSU96_15715 [Acidobacteriota bacterium]|nr:MAG: hypothetical protein JSU96_15715 [Acidobacteriota bacterium]
MRTESLVGGGAILLRISGPQADLSKTAERVVSEIRSLTETTVTESVFLDAVVGVITDLYINGADHDRFLIDTMEAILGGETVDYQTNYVLNLKQMRMGEVESALKRFIRGNN